MQAFHRLQSAYSVLRNTVRADDRGERTPPASSRLVQDRSRLGAERSRRIAEIYQQLDKLRIEKREGHRNRNLLNEQWEFAIDPEAGEWKEATTARPTTLNTLFRP